VRKVGIGEAVALAAALDVPLLSLLRPDDPEEEVTLTPELKLRAGLAYAWLTGETPLTEEGARMYADERGKLHPWVLRLEAKEVLSSPRNAKEREILRAYASLMREDARREAQFTIRADTPPELRSVLEQVKTASREELERVEAQLAEEES
jgi:hypothetical protein